MFNKREPTAYLNNYTIERKAIVNPFFTGVIICKVLKLQVKGEWKVNGLQRSLIMKINDKMKEVQRKYREEIKKQKQEHEDNKNLSKETIIVVTIIVLFIFFTYTLQGF